MKLPDLDPVMWYAILGGAIFTALLALALVVLWPIMIGQHKRRRLAELARYRLANAESDVDGAPGGAIGRHALAVTEQMVRSGGWESRFTAQIARAGLRMSPAEWVLLRTLIGAGITLVLVLLVGWAGLFFGALFGWLATAAYHRHRARRRADKFGDALPAALNLVIGSLRSGFSLIQALEAMVREVGDPVATEFGRTLAETRLGMDLDEALERLAQRTDNRDLAWAVMAIRVQREVGGNLAEVLETTVSTIREREQLRGHVKSLAAEGRLSAFILIGLPVLVATFMFVFRRDYIIVLLTDSRGLILLLIGLALLTIGGLWLSRAVRVEV